MQRFAHLLSRFRRDERGVFMIIFAVLAVVLIATSGAVVDFTGVQQARTRAQTALDAATLALQKDMGNFTEAEIKAKATTILQEHINDASIESIVDAAIKDTGNGRLTLQAHVLVPTYFVRLVGFENIRANLETEVTRASANLEIAVALDITQSMSGTRIDALKTATNNLIEDLIQTSQTPTYSKMALAPYSSSLNPGSTYRDTVRGTLTGGKQITSITWADATLRNLTIASITKSPNGSTATKINLSTKQDSLTEGDYIWINLNTGWNNATWNLKGIYRVGPKTTVSSKTVFELRNANNTKHLSNGYSGSYSGTAGRVTQCENTNCELTATVTAHGMSTGSDMFILTPGSPSSTTYATSGTYKLANSSYAATGMTTWTVGATTTNTFIMPGTDPRYLSGTNIEGSGGTSYCAEYGCLYQHYEASAGNDNVYKATDCVVERPTTTNASTDAMATTSPLGIQYANASGIYAASIGNMPACNSATIVPLTHVKSDLTAAVNALSVSGTTAGHIGLAWAWYLISPNFVDGTLETLWPANSVPHPDGEKDLVKAIILMTDGQFNTMYDKGIPSEDSHSYSGTTSVRTTNDSPLGTSSEQALALCTEIKKSEYKIELFTVGFMINSNSADDVAARDLLTSCSPDAKHRFFPNAASELDDDFNSIGKNLSELRISK